MRDADTLLQTNWTFPTLGPGGSDEVMMILSGIDALELGTIAMGSPSPEHELTEDSLSYLSPVMQGIAQGIGIALGNATNHPIQPFNIACSAAPISVGAPFVTAGAAIAIQVHYHIQEGPDGTLTLYFTPAAAAALSALAAPGAGATADDSGAATDINDVMAGFFGAQGGPGLDAGYDGMAGFGGGPMAGGPMAGSPMGGPMNASMAASMGGPMGGSPFSGGPLTSSGNPFQAFEPAGNVPDGVSRSMDLIMDIPLDVSVELGRVQMLIKDVLELATGSIVELERVAGEPVDLLVNGQLIAKGEVVVIEDNFGIRITEIISPADRLHGVGKRAA
jgi:flagellar motor switch protein FliN/FliY